MDPRTAGLTVRPWDGVNSATRTKASARMPNCLFMQSDLFNPHCAFLVVGLQRDRISGVERHLVDKLRLIEPRHEHDPARRLVASTSLDTRANEPATGGDLDFVAPTQLCFQRIVRMHEADRVWECLVEFGD